MTDNQQTVEERSDAMRSVRPVRVIVPVVLGVAVILYLLWKQFDFEEFEKIEWTTRTHIWIGMAVLCLVVRHLAYSARLRTLSENQFSWRKSIELIFIWEFSSAVSPTSVGGSAVALFVLSHEDLKSSKTTAIVIYTIVLDTLFFITTIPILLMAFGPTIIRPDITGLSSLDGWALTFVLAYIFMALYGALFFYGLFIKPRRGRILLHSIGNIAILKKWKWKIQRLAAGFVQASGEMKRQEPAYHLKAFLSTAIAWSLRFLVISCLIIAIVQTTPIDLISQMKLYARLQTMFVILAFSPTPGGSGFHEIVFGGFLSDYVPVGIAIVVALIWRLLTYYSYLIAGAIVIPQWLRGLIRKRRKRRQARLSQS